MAHAGVASAVRPGEHACCRFSRSEDRERFAQAFVRDGLRRGHRVLYLRDGDDEAFAGHLTALDPACSQALGDGRLAIRAAVPTYLPDGTFHPEQLLEIARLEHDRALADGLAGLSFTGEIPWALSDAPGFEQLTAYEERCAELVKEGSFAFLCQYDDEHLRAHRLDGVVAAHEVDAAPELAPLGRDGTLEAVRTHHGEVLRLTGELDLAVATTLAAVLDAHFDGELRLDVGDLRFVDLAGLRALRGRDGRRLAIVAASGPVRRLAGLLGWDTDPGVEMAGG